MVEWLVEQGDCLDVLRTAGDGVFDAIVTDPPYGIEPATGGMLGQVATGHEKRGGFAYGGTHTRGFADHDPLAFQSWFTDVSKEMLRVLKPGGYILSFGAARTYHRMVIALEDTGFEIRDTIAWVRAQGMPKGKNLPGGWSTTLRTVQEPIVVARKPLIGTVTENVEKHGTGALNIGATKSADGRWPTNFVMTHTESCTELTGCVPPCPVLDLGEQFPAFRYESKPSKAERAGNKHPTQKPVALMEWLIKLVTPIGGTVLDPFVGSGTTGVAAVNLGFNFIGIEREPQYVEIARARIDSAATSAAATADTVGMDAGNAGKE